MYRVHMTRHVSIIVQSVFLCLRSKQERYVYTAHVRDTCLHATVTLALHARASCMCTCACVLLLIMHVLACNSCSLFVFQSRTPLAQSKVVHREMCPRRVAWIKKHSLSLGGSSWRRQYYIGISIGEMTMMRARALFSHTHGDAQCNLFSLRHTMHMWQTK